jgi:hypothetical protein
MPLAAGTRLGPYEIVAPAGAGMGEVYRARDTRLNRSRSSGLLEIWSGRTLMATSGRRSWASVTGADVSRTDKRWLFALPVGEPNASSLILTTNWTAILKQ